MPKNVESHSSAKPRRYALVSVAAILSGCAPDSVHFPLPEIPPEIAYVAALAIEESNAVSSSGLIRVDTLSESRLEIEVSGERRSVQLIGFEKATLAAVAAPDDPALEEAHLRVKEGCEWSLPPFDFNALIEGEAALPEMTVDWLMQECPDPNSITVDRRCGIAPCEMTVAVSGCKATLSLPQCDISHIERLSGAVRRDGRLQLCLEPGGECTASAGESPVEQQLVCSGAGASNECRFDFFVGRTPPPWQPTNVVLVDARPRLPIELDREIDHHFLEAGYLGDILPLRDRVLVVSYGGQYTEGINDHAARTPTFLSTIDPLSDTISSSSTVPNALDHLIAKSDGGGFNGVFRQNAKPWIGAFDLDGRLERSTIIPIEALDARLQDVRMVGLVRMPQSEELVLVAHNMVDDRAVLFLYSQGLDLMDTLEPAPFREVLQPRGLVPLSASRLAITDDELNRVLFIDLESSEIQEVMLPISANSVGRLELHEPSGRLLVPSTGESRPLIVLESPRALAQALFFEDVTGIPTGAATDPNNPDDVLVAVTTGTPPNLKAQLAKLDPFVPRFFPGVLPLGFGAVGRLRTDEHGDVWATLPFEGTVVHLRPN